MTIPSDSQRCSRAVSIFGTSLLLTALTLGAGCGGGGGTGPGASTGTLSAAAGIAAIADSAPSAFTSPSSASTGATPTAPTAPGAPTAPTSTLAYTPPVGTPAPSGLKAFPGAEGFGAYATGGRGGAVIHVTSLAASGPGSLQAALDAPGPRTIVFDVSGVIEGVPEMLHGDVTIAGQTSPGGITLRGLMVEGDSVCEEPGCPLPTTAPTNFVIRHLRLRPGTFDSGVGGGDGLRLHHAANGIVDHVSVGNAQDEAIQVSFTHDVTIQYTLLAETIGGHVEFGGMLLNYSDPARGWPLTRLSIHHNMWNRIFGRLPEVSRENVPDSGLMDLELSNNVLWDVQRPVYVASANPQTGAPLGYRLDMVGNYSAQDPRRAESYGLMAVEFGPDAQRPSFTSASSVYMYGNRMNRAPGLSDWSLVYNANDLLEAAATGGLPYPDGQRPSNAVDAGHGFPAITYAASTDALVTDLSAHSGAFPRDPMDRRLMVNPAARTFSGTDPAVNPAGDTTALDFTPSTAPAAPIDTDGDGIPDAWEAANGLNPSDRLDGNATTLSLSRMGVEGYTNLEVYLDARHRGLLGAAAH